MPRHKRDRIVLPAGEPDYSAIERRFDYRFSSPELLRAAFHINSNGTTIDAHQGMEKEGDRLLAAVTVNLLRTEYPQIGGQEGELARRESVLTRNENLAHLAVRMNLPEFLGLGVREPVFDSRIWADLMEAIFCAIALDAGGGDSIAGLLQLRRVVRRLFQVDLQLCQVENPWETLVGQVRVRTQSRERIRPRLNFIHIGHKPMGYTSTLHFGSQMAQKVGARRIAGTGVTERMALQKACALSLLYLWPSKYPHNLPPIKSFSWRIKAASEIPDTCRRESENDSRDEVA